MNDFIQKSEKRFNGILDNYLHMLQCPDPLRQAMQTSLKNGGKRLRPLLIYATGTAFGADLVDLDGPALAIEFMHTYSLIHDDLPSMDNADTRRGQPSCHVTHGEACAILAGDTLQALAFEVLATYPANLSANQRILMVKALAKAAGMEGMAGGQMLDINTPTELTGILKMYAMKTGALIKTSLHLGSLAISEDTFSSVEKLAENLGLAFQIQDDLFDIESTAETLGKPTGADKKNKKNTVPHLIGIKAAKENVDALFSEAFLMLNSFGDSAECFRQLLRYIQLRKK